MKKTLFYYIAAVMCGLAAATLTSPAVQAQTPPAQKQEIVDGVTISDVKIARDGRYLSVGMLLNLEGLEVKNNRAVLLTPRLVNGSDSLVLPSVGIYGRRRYYVYVRNSESLLTDREERSYKAADKPASFDYDKLVPFCEWMDGASLKLCRSDYGCCNTLLSEQEGVLGHHTEPFFPELLYIRPTAKRIKSRSLEGSAYIDFPTNKTEIHPDYRRNAAELGKIRATIDSVRSDRDVTITQVWLKGYASPESSYDHNRELAIGRTDALKSYIKQFYHFDDDVIATDYEPEDWAGLRRYVEQSDLEHKAEILDLIDSDREPDNKEWAIKKYYPEEYRFLLQNCYPALRHTDYRIAYTIRGYSDPEEISRVMAEQPQKLDLNEFYLVAQEYEPGTEPFTEVFETAVRMYPADERANLNAANAAMRRGDNAAAARYLDRAGNSPEAVYARGALAVRMKDYETARRYLSEAKSLGVVQAATTLAELDYRNK